MSKKLKKRSLEAAKTRVGYTFVIGWLVGLVLFFLIPIINSLWYGFNDVTIEPGEIVTEFVGLEHFKHYLQKDPNYVNDLRDSIGMMCYSLPIIISVSLIFAVMLNQKFRGRTIVRAIFFIPVIMANSAAMNQLTGQMVQMPLFTSGERGVGIIDYNSIIQSLNVPSQVSPFLAFLITNTIDLIWNCGVPSILFLSGLQSIPASHYEVSKIEGANKWEEFWLITVPSLRHIISLVLIYTMIELFVSMNNSVVASSYSAMVNQFFGESSAMLWMYFVLVFVFMGIILGLYQRFCMKRWE